MNLCMVSRLRNNTMRHLTILFLLLAVQSICTAQKKIVINGGAAPSLVSQLTNDLNFVQRTEMIDSLASLESKIQAYEWIFGADGGANQTILDGETVNFFGGPGLRTSTGTNSLSILYDFPGLSTIAGAQVGGSNQLLLYRGGTNYATVSVDAFESQLPKNWTMVADQGDSGGFATFNIGGVFNITGNTGIHTAWNNTSKTLSFNLDPYNNLSTRTALNSDYVLTFDDTNIGYTAISDIIPTSTYSFNIQADDSNSDVINSGEIIDFESGTGLISSLANGNDVVYSLNLHNLTEQTPATTDNLVWFDDSGNYYRVDVANLPISSGSGDITAVNTAGGSGLGGGTTSGAANLFLDIIGLTLTGTADARDRLPVASYNHSNGLREKYIGDMVLESLTSSDGSINISQNSSTQVIDLTTSSTSSFSGNYTDLNFGGTTGLLDGVDNGKVDGTSNADSEGIVLDISGGVLSASLAVTDLPFVSYSDGISGTDLLPAYTQKNQFGNNSPNEHRIQIIDMLRSTIVDGNGSAFPVNSSSQLEIAAGGGGVQSIVGGTAINVLGSASNPTVSVDVEESYELSHAENHGINSQDIRFVFVPSNTTQYSFTWHLTTSATLQLPDPDFAPEGAVLNLIIDRSSGGINATLDPEGSQIDMLIYDGGARLRSQSFIVTASCVMTLRRMIDPLDDSNYVWCAQYPY